MTVQLPVYNEPRVVGRVIEAVAALDYPSDRLQIQVLDDSTDATGAIVRPCCERLQRAGLEIVHIRRNERRGYKAGALAHGLGSATGELIAVFDADFVPPRDFLRRTVDHFTDDGVGLVQTRWSHLNRDDSLLTRLQAMSLDAHFLIEQTARARSGRWFNFNGTAGIWRRACIDDAGGWQHDTLTEDTDLSYRAQRRGWRFVYLPEVTCPAEIPPTVHAFMGQQHRWNKGLIQTAIKLLPGILRSDAPLRNKLEAWFHLTSPVPYLSILLLTIVVIPSLLVALPVDGVRPALALGLGTACLGLGTMAAATFYLAAELVQGAGLGRTLLRLIALMAVGIGVSLLNSRAILEALFGLSSGFVRTPKFDGAAASDTDPLARRHGPPDGLVEVVLGVAMVAAIVAAVVRPVTLVGVPFLALFAAGYLAVGLRALQAPSNGSLPRPDARASSPACGR